MSPNWRKQLSRRVAEIVANADHFQKDVGDSYSLVCLRYRSTKLDTH